MCLKILSQGGLLLLSSLILCCDVNPSESLLFLFPIRSSPASSAFEMFEVNDLLFQNINTKLAYKDEDTYLSGPEPDLKEVVKGTWLRSDRCRTETYKKIFSEKLYHSATPPPSPPYFHETKLNIFVLRPALLELLQK